MVLQMIAAHCPIDFDEVHKYQDGVSYDLLIVTLPPRWGGAPFFREGDVHGTC